MKDIEWLKEEVENLDKETSQNYPHEETVELPSVLRLIDQLYEPEFTESHLISFICEKYGIKNRFFAKRALGIVFDNIDSKTSIGELLDKFERSETLSKKWIENHTAGAYTIAHYSEEDVPVVTVYDLENLLVPKLDLPVIPDYVAEYIKNEKESEITLEETLENMGDPDFQEIDIIKETSEYVKNNIIDFIDAYRDGYTVEEKKYKVFIGEAYEGRGLFLSKSPYDGTVTIGTNLDYFRNRENNKETHLTEQEIKDYDERYFAFAVPVDGLDNALSDVENNRVNTYETFDKFVKEMEK